MGASAVRAGDLDALKPEIGEKPHTFQVKDGREEFDAGCFAGTTKQWCDGISPPLGKQPLKRWALSECAPGPKADVVSVPAAYEERVAVPKLLAPS